MCYGSSGYGGPKTYAELQAWHDKPRRRSNVCFSSNTYAYRGEDGAFTITLHWTDIVKVHASGVVELIGLWNSLLTKTRYKAFFQDTRCDVWNEKIDGIHKLVFYRRGLPSGEYMKQEQFEAALAENPKLAARRFNWVIPAMPGMRSDFEPTAEEQALHIAARIGDADAARKLADLLDARGEHIMAKATRAHAGVRYGHRGWFADMKRFVDSIYHVAHESGAWLKRGKRLVRPLTRYEVELLGIDPNGNDATIDGVTYDIVDGALWVAHTKSAAYVLRQAA
jgi:hypothetical protein